MKPRGRLLVGAAGAVLLASSLAGCIQVLTPEERVSTTLEAMILAGVTDFSLLLERAAFSEGQGVTGTSGVQLALEPIWLDEEGLEVADTYFTEYTAPFEVTGDERNASVSFFSIAEAENQNGLFSVERRWYGCATFRVDFSTRDSVLIDRECPTWVTEWIDGYGLEVSLQALYREGQS